jgi:hypothetical protein
MKKNMGNIEQAPRIIAAVEIVGLFFTHIISGTVAIILMVFAAIFILTSFISFCPLYYPFKISTKKSVSK